ncbi:ucpB, partial [Symbiodinium sp. KB8]
MQPVAYRTPRRAGAPWQLKRGTGPLPSLSECCLLLSATPRLAQVRRACGRLRVSRQPLTATQPHDAVTNPIDVAKIRLQLQGLGGSHAGPKYKGFLDCMVQVGRTEGLHGLFKGLVPCILREMSYSSIRLGLYEPTKELLGGSDRHNTPLWMKVSAGAITGSVGSYVTTPIDLAKVRLQADVSGTAHGGTRDILKRVYAQEASQVPSYDHIKHSILNAGLMQEGLPLHMVCSTAAGFISALTTTPVDLIKTRLMNQGGDGARMYRGVSHCISSIVAEEGAAALMKGFWPNWIRIAPHTTVSLIVFEGLRKAV